MSTIRLSEPRSGLVPGLPAEVYHSGDEVSISRLKLMERSPLHYRHSWSQSYEETPAMRLGTAVHTAILEPELFRETVAIAPERRSNDGKAEYAELEAAGFTLITEAQMEQCLGMAAAVQEHPEAPQVLAGGEAEVSAYWYVDHFDVPCRARFDWLRPVAIVDVKTTSKGAGPAAFARQCANLHYHAQAAWYVDGLDAITGEVLPFVFVVVETEAPYAVGLYTLNVEAMQLGRERYQDWLVTLTDCIERDEWPGPTTGIETLSLPKWAHTA